jgi:hypothetical protein
MTRRILLAGTAAVAACAAIYLYGLIRWDRQVVADFETGASR